MANLEKIQRLLRETSRYEVLVHQNPDAICGITSDGYFFEVNDACGKLLGYPCEELLGAHFQMIIFPEETAIHIKRLQNRGSSVAHDTIPMRLRHSSGVPVYALVNAVPIIISGAFVGAYYVIKNVQDRLHLRVALDAVNSSLHHAQQLANFGNWVWEVASGRVTGSREMMRMFGFQADGEDIFMGTILDLVEMEDKETLMEALQSAIKGVGMDVEFWLRRHCDGRLKLFQAVAQPVCDDFGDVVYLVGSIHDMTEQRETENYLRRHQSLTIAGQLAAGVAHEIRNPLTAVKGFLQLMPTLPEPTSAIQLMLDELSRIERIVNELLVLAKPQPVHFTKEDLGIRLDEVVQLLGPQAMLNNIVVHLTVAEDVPLVDCEVNQLKQVFINVLKNGMEAMPNGGRIGVILESLKAEEVSIRIRDSGLGMTDAQLQKLGQPFFTTKEHGTGLGWMISEKIIQHHRGAIDLASVVGEGTSVTIRLPITQPYRRSQG